MRLLLLIPALMLLACPSTGGSFFADPDPEPTPPDEEASPGEDARMAWVELHRSWEYGGGATLRATASFHSPSVYDLWPTASTDLDGCAGGESPPGAWVIPDSELDVGTPVLHLGDDQVELSFDGTHWFRQLSTSSWEEHQEFALQLSGGPDLPAQFYEAVIGSPATLTFDTFDAGDDGITVAWTGANDDGDIRVLIYNDEDPMQWAYCRLDDDGLQEMPWSTFDGLIPEGDYTFEARRQRSVDFEMGEYPGTTLGLSSATADVTVRTPSADSSEGR